MKNMKKITSIIMTVIMVFAMMTTAFADTTTTGTITINNIESGQTYSVYRILDLESYDSTTGAYSYRVNSAWETFLNTEAAKKCLSVDATGYVTWTGADDAETVATFAKDALAWAKTARITAIATSNDVDVDGNKIFAITGDTVKSGTFSDLPLGYYLVDSSLGALCGLTTMNPNASVNEKNAKPTMDKQVQEDSSETWGKTNTADVGQTVNYRVIITGHEGAQRYVLHDTMSDGLTFSKVSKVEHQITKDNDTHTSTEGTHYEVVTETTDGCTFEVRFTDAFCESLQDNDKIYVYYEAIVNENAVIAGTGNPNTAKLSYGETSWTEESETVTYTYEVDLVKTDSQNVLIDGATFKIYDAATNGNEVKVKAVTESGTTVYYRDKALDDTETTGAEIVVSGGKTTIRGLDNGTYYLEEIAAPAGYNKLTERKAFTISGSNLNAIFNDGAYSTGSGVHVVNKTGTMLPDTGGIGTTLFYVLGGGLVLAAVVLLITKKRMGNNAE